MLAEAGGGEWGTGGSSCLRKAALTQPSGGGPAMAPGRLASGRRSSSECIKLESWVSHASPTLDMSSVH